MPGNIKLRKGLTIRLLGKAHPELLSVENSRLYAITPDNYKGVVPKLLVKTDDIVKAGTPIFFDKDIPEIKFVSPVSGKVIAINRGERRIIMNIVIEADGKQEYKNTVVTSLQELSREQIIGQMLENGLWPFVIQRPFGTIANPKDEPKAIFISGFDTSPLAPDLDIILKGEEDFFQKGIDTLKKLTSGKIHVGINSTTKFFSNISGIELTNYNGPHPAGNVGIQIHHVDPINKGETVWTLRPEDVVVIGKFFKKGIFDISRVIALVGSEVKKTGYIRTIAGAKVKPFLKENTSEKFKRVISGNVLTGTNISDDGYLGFYDRMVTVIPEGNTFEFLGWALPGLKKFSMSRTFTSWLTPSKQYTLDTNFHGAERAYVMTDQYEKVLPMDILPHHLIKAALIDDVELMEKLGIYEVVEEDLALCEYVCTSKIEVQSILRKALDLIKKEMS